MLNLRVGHSSLLVPKLHCLNEFKNHPNRTFQLFDRLVVFDIEISPMNFLIGSDFSHSLFAGMISVPGLFHHKSQNMNFVIRILQSQDISTYG
jgi:hypothetical protein